MKTGIKKLNLFAAKWWNPLLWLFVVLAPVFWAFAYSVGGAFYSLLMGYKTGLEKAWDKLHELLSKMS